jgi:fatty-acyl-CoA synthase
VYTVSDFVRLNGQRHAGTVAVVDETRSLTHGQLSGRATALARGLIDAGVRPGDRVGVLTGNVVFGVETLLGVALAGAVYVPFNWRWATEELVLGTNLTRPRVVLVEQGFVPAFDAALATGELDPAMQVYREGEEYERLFRSGGNPVDVAVGLDDPLCILFTGGTTGQSKGVVLSHRSAITNALNELVDLGFGQQPGSVGLNITPLFHSAALLCVFMPHYITGGTNVLMQKFDEDAFGDVLEREKVKSTFIIPNMIRRLVKAGTFDRPGLRTNFRQLHTGGGLLRMPDKDAVFQRLPDVQMFYRYGLTEGGPMLTRLHHVDIRRPELDGSIGKEYSFVEVQVQDEEGNEMPAGEMGEICARGPGMMLGYFDRPEETKATFRGGWLHTGDLAVRDSDGYLFFRDRAKDMIKTGGENVYAAEIEQLLYAHPAVMECGVLGVASVEWDEEVRAVVALRDGATASPDELSSYLRGHLAGYKIPKQYLFVEPRSMPVNPSGKIVKAALRRFAGW